MYPRLRNVHLAIGLSIAVFLLARVVTGIGQAYPVYDPLPIESSLKLDDVPAAADASPRALATWVMTSHGLRGALSHVETEDNDVSVTIERPGTSYLVEHTRGTTTAEVTVRRHNAVGALYRIHQTAGLTSEDWVTRAWGWATLLASFALLGLACSGLAMWFMRHKERRAGAVVLGVGLAWGLGLLLLVRLA